MTKDIKRYLDIYFIDILEASVFWNHWCPKSTCWLARFPNPANGGPSTCEGHWLSLWHVSRLNCRILSGCGMAFGDKAAVMMERRSWLLRLASTPQTYTAHRLKTFIQKESEPLRLMLPRLVSSKKCHILSLPQCRRVNNFNWKLHSTTISMRISPIFFQNLFRSFRSLSPVYRIFSEGRWTEAFHVFPVHRDSNAPTFNTKESGTKGTSTQIRSSHGWIDAHLVKWNEGTAIQWIHKS